MWRRITDFFFNHWIFRFILRPLIIAYLFLLLVAWLFLDALLFPAPRASYEDSADIIKLKSQDGVNISARYMPQRSAKYTVLYSHGNGEDMGEDEFFYQQIAEWGFSLFIYDYHGYGTSGGVSNEENLYLDIDAAYLYLTEKLDIPPSRIIVYGRSLGGGPSIYLAARHPVAGLILESTFATACRAKSVLPILPFDRFPNARRIHAVRCPVLIMHGRKDNVIRFANSEALFRAANSPKMTLWIDNAGHNDFRDIAGEKLPNALANFSALIEKQRAGIESKQL